MRSASSNCASSHSLGGLGGSSGGEPGAAAPPAGEPSVEPSWRSSSAAAPSPPPRSSKTAKSCAATCPRRPTPPSAQGRPAEAQAPEASGAAGPALEQPHRLGVPRSPYCQDRLTRPTATHTLPLPGCQLGGALQGRSGVWELQAFCRRAPAHCVNCLQRALRVHWHNCEARVSG